uniref:Growth hormone inducible transmembrane protein n=1 Tax=Neogobius melanostomus TaxID=47308 RepID=A0A8C6TZ73_9GOBI
MLVARLSCLRALPLAPGIRSGLKTCPPLLRPQQGFSSRPRFGFRKTQSTREQLKDAAFKPVSETALKIDSTGRLILAGGAAVGLGALCYYGLGMSNEIGAIEKAVIWPQYVKDRIHSTYMYFAGSVGLTALSAVAVSRTPALLGLMMRGSWLAIGATFAAMIGAGMLVRSISYEHSPMPKHLAWMLHAGVMGAVIAPMTLLGGPLMLRAAWYTAGIVGGLSTVAMCAPSEKFLNMGDLWPSGSESSSPPPSARCSCPRPRRSALGCTLWRFTAVCSSSARSCCTTHRRSSRERRLTRSTACRNMTPSTRVWAFTWTQ